MDGSTSFYLVFTVLGGLGLFILGMGIMSDGLRIAAGSGLRTLLSKATANRFAGLALGTLLGFLVHSSAASVMLVGFLNAGLMNLAQAIAPMLGTNLGTSLSMQLVSFRLADYCYVGIVAGLAVQMAVPNPRAKSIGRALLGFGLLFLGMKTMSAAIAPHRDLLRHYLTAIDGHTFSGRLLGVGLAFALTAIIQSSGATIGMAFALADAGVFDSLWQTYPVVIGAQIGTCATALLGSIGAGIDARRAAAGNLLTNVANAGLSIALAPLWVPLFARTSPDLVRQTANAHTLLMLQNCAVFLPIVPIYARGLRILFPSRLPPPEPSHLRPDLLDYPEQAIAACLRELRRVARLCRQSLQLAGETLLFAHAAKDVQTIRLNEQAINEIKRAMKDYLADLTRRHLSKRQAILVQHVDRCMSDLERIGDHVETLCNVSLRRRRIPAAIVDRLSFSLFFQLYEAALHVLKLLAQSFDPDRDDIPAVADRILLARDDYAQASQTVRVHFNEEVSARAMTPAAGIFFAEYMAALDRIVRHARNVALAEKQPQFWIKRQKLEKRVGLAPDPAQDVLVDPREYLPRLRDGLDDPE
jgi:phosphate:Na+ symporter